MKEVKFKHLSEKDEMFIKTVHSDKSLSWDERMSIVMNKYQISERTVRRWIKKIFSKHAEAQSEDLGFAKNKRLEKKGIYIVTWAQNATAVHPTFWKNLTAYAEFLDAGIHVVAGRYLNPSLYHLQGKLNSYEWWDDVLRPHLDVVRHDMHQYVTLLSDVKVQPTASDPLSGLEGVTGAKTCIIGHPRVHLSSLPVLQGHSNKLLLTTGACTIRNYSDTKAGKKGEFHHTYGFVIVEIKDDLTYFIRQVTANNAGEFTDLYFNVKDGEVNKINTCAAFIMGDIHHDELYKPVFDKTLDYFKDVKPRNVILHDVLNGTSINHHEAKNPIKSYHKYKNGTNEVLAEVNDVLDFLEGLLEYNPKVVRSNHDEWIDRWIVSADWKKDVPNSVEYMKWGLALLEQKAPKGILPYLIQERFGDRIQCFDSDDSYKISGWEIAQHGYVGAHGSKGGVNQFKKLNTKIIVGDSHTPCRRDGALSAGTYTNLRMGYNLGPSAWMHSGVIIHEDGKAQHVIFIDDEFTTLKSKL